MQLLDLGVVVLNWNGIADTLACLESIYGDSSVPAYVVVVDNGSTDASVPGVLAWLNAQPNYCVAPLPSEEVTTGVREFRLRRLPEGRAATSDDRTATPEEQACVFAVIENERNLGFAAGNNVGIRYLLERSVEYVLLLNNDTVVAPDALAMLAMAMNAERPVQCMIPQIRYWSEPTRIWNCGGAWTWFGSPRYYHAEASIDVLEGQAPFTVDFVTGCALIIRSSWLAEQGGLSERFFHGEEDVEFSWRMRAAAPRSMMCWPSAVVYHKVGSSVSRMAQLSRLPMVYCHYLNRLIFLRTVWGRGPRWQVRRLVTVAYLAWQLNRRYRFSFRDALSVAGDLLSDSSQHDGVSAELFMWIMREKFGSVPATP